MEAETEYRFTSIYKTDGEAITLAETLNLERVTKLITSARRSYQIQS